MPTAAAIIGSSLIGGAASIFGADKAAKAQKRAAADAANLAMNQSIMSRADLQPYRFVGGDASRALRQNMSYFQQPITMDQAALEKTPGYQFTLAQGLKGVANSAAARGLGTSGAALKGAANYATGLADSTYLDQFNVENTNRNNAYNRLMGMANLGENAAAGTGALGMQGAQMAGNALIGAGNADAARYNAIGQSVAGMASSIPSALMMNKLLGGSGGTAAAPSNNGTLWGTSWWG